MESEKFLKILLFFLTAVKLESDHAEYMAQYPGSAINPHVVGSKTIVNE